jgi:hypothetical protein
MMRWLDPDWRAEAEAWIRERVGVTGPIEQPHVYPWSTVMRVPTADGDVWFKAVALAAHAFEPALSLLLSEAFPDRVTRVVAIDAERGWMLMRDSGTRLRDVMESAEDLHHWETVLPAYADLQIALARRADELRRLGVPDEGLGGLPGKVEALLDDDEALLLDEPEGLTSEQRDELRSRLPEVRSLTEELAAFAIPETIQHDDLHDGQVFVQDGRYVISDWGDSCISHPFHTLTVTLRAIAWRWKLEPRSEPLLRLRDAYLEPYGPYASAVDIAYRTGTLARALAWHRFLLAREPEERDRDDLESVPYGLTLFLENGPIGTWDTVGQRAS